jgi:transposase
MHQPLRLLDRLSDEQVEQPDFPPPMTSWRSSIDNNQVENQIRQWALGRSNWLFAGSLRSGKRAAAIMSLIQSARMNGHDPYAYLKDVLTRMPTQRASEIDRLLPQQ